MTVPAPARARSADWLERAEKVMPGGVNSPVRAFRTVGGMAPFIASAKGARATTVDGDPASLRDFRGAGDLATTGVPLALRRTVRRRGATRPTGRREER